MKSQFSDVGNILRRHYRGYSCPICGGRSETPRRKGLGYFSVPDFTHPSACGDYGFPNGLPITPNRILRQ